MCPGTLQLPQDPSGRAVFERAFETLRQANRVLLTSTSESELLADTCRVLVDTAGYRMAWVGYGEHGEAQVVQPVASYGQTDYLSGLTVTWNSEDPYGRGPIGSAIRTGRIQVVRDTDTDPGYAPWRELARLFGFRSICALPFEMTGGTGALGIYAAELNAFDAPALELFAELAANLRFGIRRIWEATRIDESLKATVGALAAAVELRDPYTAGHQRRVAELATAICHYLGKSADDADGIRLAAMMHDIGKLGVPIEILTTIAPLSTLQYEFIKLHSQFGQAIVGGIDFPWPVGEWVLQHHERLNGSGYPRGLRGDDILQGSRIIAVADVYEAMTTNRPYRPTKGHHAAIRELRGGAGRLYDFDVVEACVTVMEASDFRLLDGVGRPPRTED